LRRKIEQEFGQEVQVQELPDRGLTGNFDVKIDGNLIHSKKQLGQDRCESKASTENVLANIKATL